MKNVFIIDVNVYMKWHIDKAIYIFVYVNEHFCAWYTDDDKWHNTEILL